MSYATVDDAKELYGEDYVLTSVVRVEGKADEDALTSALVKASSEIDSYLATQYTTPVSPVPALLVQYAVDIAIYRCSSAPGAGLTEEKRTRYDDALSWLKTVAKGLAALPVGPAGESDPEHLVEISSQDRLFTRTSMRGLL